jgi:isopenicillin-N N-acyltransferase-like protein
MDGMTRRHFLSCAAGAAATLALAPARAADPARPAPPHTLTCIRGNPRERGRAYGAAFRDGIQAFLRRELYDSFTKTAPTREEVLRYAAACEREVKGYSPELHDELEGMAEGAGIRIEEAVLMSLHEELWHRGVLPRTEKCTAVAIGPPYTADGATYVGQTWDWMESVYGLSSMLLWERTGGPSLLSYAYPGLWAGAGMNANGVALTWTSGDGKGIAGPRVGIPSYLLIAQMLYQPTLKEAIAEARRAKHAGWFTFVLGDRNGDLANVEGTPEELVVETDRGRISRVLFGTKKLATSSATGERQVHARCRRMEAMLDQQKGKLDRAALAHAFSAHQAPGAEAVCLHNATIDAMVFDVTRSEAHLTRGPTCTERWHRFGFDGGPPRAG